MAQTTVATLAQVASAVLLIEVTGRDGQSASRHQPRSHNRQPEVETGSQQYRDVCYLFKNLHASFGLGLLFK